MTDRRVGSEGLRVDTTGGEQRVAGIGAQTDITAGPVDRQVGDLQLQIEVVLPPTAVSALDSLVDAQLGNPVLGGLQTVVDLAVSSPSQLGALGLTVDYTVSAVPTDTVLPDTIGTAAQVYAPTITLAAGPQTVQPDSIVSAAQVYPPALVTLVIVQTVAPDTILSAAVVYAAGIPVQVNPDPIPSVARVYEPTVRTLARWCPQPLVAAPVAPAASLRFAHASPAPGLARASKAKVPSLRPVELCRP